MIRPTNRASTGEPGWEVSIIVTNVGERPVTITDAGWWFGRGTHFPEVESGSDVDVTFPFRLDSSDQVKITGFVGVKDGWGGWDQRHKRIPYRTYITYSNGVTFRLTTPFVEYVGRKAWWRRGGGGDVIRLNADPMAIESPFSGLVVARVPEDGSIDPRDLSDEAEMELGPGG